MGTLMAVSSLPRVLISPFAGVLVDRTDRKWMIVLTDAVRGVAITGIALAAFAGALEVWMVFAAGVLLGVMGAFFFPAVGSAIPDLVPSSGLVRANAAYSMAETGSSIVGNSAGGFLFQLLGAPVLFLVNGLSFLFSAASELFIRIPRIIHRHAEFRFWADLKQGMRFVWQYRGIRYTMLIAAGLNFFGIIGAVLFLPLFERTAHLGPGLYGVEMAAVTGGMLLGYLLASVVNIPYPRRFLVFYAGGVASVLAVIGIPALLWFPAMRVFGFVFGLLNAVINSLLRAVLQTATPGDLRGKVFGLMSTMTGGLMPFAMALAGVLAEFIPLRPLIAGSFVVMLFGFILVGFSRPTRHLLNYNPETTSLDAIR
jgi:DHA3 family macrolide efflux protein-like MFS transporter